MKDFKKIMYLTLVSTTICIGSLSMASALKDLSVYFFGTGYVSFLVFIISFFIFINRNFDVIKKEDIERRVK